MNINVKKYVEIALIVLIVLAIVQRVDALKNIVYT
ncbi:MAG: hypothetical protein DDT42_01736 [candidate division WS2 bacterium]|uniref:Uncharacterized protein n=1 Tax=Psychracetigena formicireducens TaxID=2986056 RepID=A0A9E2F1V4_PSYF1|nr:hypothetical protein [Candidatus Psychracetigena formicireducens]MBT9145859.1 hypothetical protein [Candidatus Psychracetigena formicireducens]